MWNWFADDYGARFAENSAMLILMTRWHVDDLLGRYLEHEKNVRIIRYPAIAEHDEAYRDKGEPLFKELKSLGFLLDRKRMMTQASWESEYQQNPIIAGGGTIPVEKMRILPTFAPKEVIHAVLYVDKAATPEGKGRLRADVLDEGWQVLHWPCQPWPLGGAGA